MIQFENVSKSYVSPRGAVQHALRAVDLTIAPGESLCLIGPSGCGKTTLLKILNRLIEPSAGRVLVEGTDTADLDPVELRRRMGYVVQSGALFPHLTVAGNVGLLCALVGWDEARTSARVSELLELVALESKQFGERYPRELSGGQRQRVGVARALALDPPIVLMDEPFGALDPVTRHELQREFIELRKRVDKTMVIVTHDMHEAFRLGDRVALLCEGRLAQVATPAELRASPASDFVAGFIEEQLSD